VVYKLFLEYFTKKLVRSSGPGGQHVNKVATKAEIRFNVNRASEWLEPDILERFMKVEQNRISKLGDYIISSDKTREAVSFSHILELYQGCF
jgi:protein subunit release factor B